MLKSARLIGRNKVTPMLLFNLVDQGRAAYVRGNAPDQPLDYQQGIAAAFLAGACMAMKITTEIDVPWVARNMVNEAGERAGKEALKFLPELAA